MNKERFLRELEQLLSDIPESERREAMEYYQNYFEDAEPGEEAKIIEELGSPQEVAASIKKDLFGENYQEYNYAAAGNPYQEKRSGNNTARNILIAVIAILGSPLWLALLCAAFGLLIGGIACIFGLSVAVVAIVGSFFVMSVVLIGIGVGQMAAGLPAVGLVVLAIGLLMLSAALLGLIVLAWALGRVFPWVLRAVVRLCKRPFQKRGASI